MKKLFFGLALFSSLTQAGTKSHVSGFETGTGMFFGRGFDVVANDTKGDCVKIQSYSFEPENHQNSIYRQHYSLELIENIDELAKSLSISASASLKWGLGKGSAAMNYLQTQKINRYSLYILVKQEIITHYKNAHDPEIKEDFLKKLQRNKKSFRAACGDEYITSATYGGTYYGILRLDTSDEENHRSLRVQLSAKVGAFKGSTELQETITQIAKDKTLKISTYRLGGEVQNQPTDLTEFMNELEIFPHLVVKSPVPIEAFTNTYDTIGNFPINSNIIETDIQEGVMTYLGNKRLSLIKIRNDIQYINENPAQFKNPNFEILQGYENQINRELTKIENYSISCFNDLSKCKNPDDLNIPKVILPQRKIRMTASTCEKRVDKVCGYIYHEERSPSCPVETYTTEIQPSCGVENFKSSRGEICGVESYHSGRNQVCGVEKYKANRGSQCGCEVLECSGNRCNGGALKSAQRRCETYYECRHPDFGVEAFKNCEHPVFGVNNFKECRHESFGVETYLSCQSQTPATYEFCQAPAHGIRGVKECLVKEITDNHTNETSLVKCE